MSLRIRADSRIPVYQTGCVAQINLWRGFVTNLQYIASNTDLLMRAWPTDYYWFSRSMPSSLEQIFSFYPRFSSEDPFVESFDVLQGSREPGSAYDSHTYGSIYDGFRILGTAISGQSFIAPSHSSEHSCEHVTYSGELTAKQSDLPTGTYDMYIGSSLIHVQKHVPYAYRRCVVNSLIPGYGVTLYNIGSTLTDYSLDSLFGQMVGKEFEGTFSWGSGTWHSYLSDLDITKTDQSLTVTWYSQVFGLSPTLQHYAWRCKFYMPFAHAEPTRLAVVGGDYRCLYSGQCYFQFTVSDAYPYDSARVFNVIPYADHDLRTFDTILSIPTHSPSEERTVVCDIHTTLQKADALIAFKRAVSDSWHHITPSALFSTVDAYQECEGYLGTNILQNLTKIPSIVSALPQIGEAIRLLGKIVKRRVDILTIKDILKLLASTNLQLNFQWKPYGKVLTDYLPVMQSTLHSLGDIKANAIGRGSFSFKINNDLGREEVTLLTRTKLVMDASPSGLLSAVLGIDALGLLPKASNLWDLLPFSFVANWFTGVGQSMRRVEYSLLLATIPAYYVHSYTLSSPFTQSELDTMEASNSTDERSSLKLFYRDVTLHSPAPMDSRFGFGIPNEYPPLGLFGSLLFQLIFH